MGSRLVTPEELRERADQQRRDAAPPAPDPVAQAWVREIRDRFCGADSILDLEPVGPGVCGDCEHDRPRRRDTVEHAARYQVGRLELCPAHARARVTVARALRDRPEQPRLNLDDAVLAEQLSPPAPLPVEKAA